MPFFLTERRMGARRGFTMVELLVVIVIIGVLAAMIAPSFSTSSEIVRVKTASRGVIQMSRYARNMALLYQTPLDLVYSSDGTLSVERGNSGTERMVSSGSFTAGITAVGGNAAEGTEEEEALSAGEPEGDGKGGGSTYTMAELTASKKYERISFVFEGYTDSVDDRYGQQRTDTSPVFKQSRATEDDPMADDVESFKIRYRSNGTCRPYKVLVKGEDDAMALRVVIDLLGTAKVEDDE